MAPPTPDPSLMRDDNDKTVLAIALVSLLGLVLSLVNHWFLLGLVTWLMMVLAVAVGYGREKSHKPILYTLLGMLLVYWALLGGMAWMDHTQGEPVLLLGLPFSTALLVYGIWPIGVVWGILYFLVFDQSVLPKRNLEKFLAEYGRRK